MDPEVTFTFADSSYVEHAGEIVSGTRVAIFKSYNQTDSGSALDYAGMPQPGDGLTADLPNVKLVDRNVTFMRQGTDGNSMARVELRYELQRPEARPVRGGVSMSQIKTMNYPNGQPIIVEYPALLPPDPNEPIDPEEDPVEVVRHMQRGEISVMAPQSNIVLPLSKTTNKPDVFATKYVTHVNKTLWRHGKAGMWLCTRGDYELNNDRNSGGANAQDVYDFQFEFEKSTDEKDGWDVTVVWRDKQTGQVPTDITGKSIGTTWPGTFTPTGPVTISNPMITFTYYPTAEFSTDFPEVPVIVEEPEEPEEPAP